MRLLPALCVAAVLLPLAACVTTSADYVDPATGKRSGRLLYERRCAECHALYAPSSYSPAQWRPIVEEMAELAHLDAEDSALIRDYLVEAAARR
jgi:mono/diheme cytochrome c family protein